MYQTLALDKELRQVVDFIYIPLNHINPNNGSYICNGMACDAVKFESCLVQQYCWYKGICNTTNQLKVARFMKCFEGPYANREAIPDPSRRKLCMKQAQLNYSLVLGCVSNKTQVDKVEYELNLTRLPMYKSLGPQPGLFPHIFVNNNHLWNNSWTSLVRILCNEIKTYNFSICGANSVDLSFSLVNTKSISLNKTYIANHIPAFESAILQASNFLSSKAWLPINFQTHQPDGSPSYVNIQAINSVTILKLNDGLGSKGETIKDTIDVQVRIELLNAFYYNKGIINEIVGLSFPSYLAWALRKNGFDHVNPDNIKNQNLTKQKL